MLNRSLEVKKNRTLSKVLMDRNFAFHDKYDEKSDMIDKMNISSTGDLEEYDEVPEYEQKMPMRIGYHTPKLNKKKYIEPVHNDFDVFDSKSKLEEVSGFVHQHSNLELEEDKGDYFREKYKSQVSLDESSIYNNVVNEESYKILNILKDYINKKFVAAPYNLMLVLAVMYKLSNNSQLKKFFKYNREIVYDGLVSINKRLNKSHIVSYNAIYNGSTDVLNQVTKRNFDNVVDIDNINSSANDCGLSNVLNKKVISYMLKEMKKIFGREYRCDDLSIFEVVDDKLVNKKTEILGITLTYLRSYWNDPFVIDNNGVFYKSIRNGMIEERCKMMTGYNLKLKYFSDEKVQHVELDLNDNDLKVGIVLPKTNIELLFTSDKLLSNIEKMRNVSIGTVTLPVFKFVTSMRLDKLLIKLGLKTLYQSLSMKDLILKDTRVSNIVHRTIVDIDCCNRDKTDIKKKYREEFIANHPFVYYVRYNPTNTFVVIGYYN